MTSQMAELYRQFRAEIDSYCAIPIVLNLDTRPVIHEGKTVGLLILCDDYVDSFYILPEYRRKGIGRKFIIEQYWKDNCKWYDLRIVKGNYTAHGFWHSIFDLRFLDSNFCDNHFEILGLKEPKA